MMKRYRIGELAEELGVTSSFIKNCERYGILETYVEPNGYRFFSFNQSAHLIEYMKLQNQGYQAKEIRHFLKDSSLPELIEDMESRKSSIEKSIRYQQSLLKYYEEAPKYLEYFSNNEWFISNCPAFYFLPHTEDSLYSGRKAIHDVVKDWNEWFPIVRSTRKITSLGSYVSSTIWGLSVSDTFAREQRLLINNEVQFIPPRKCLVIFKRGIYDPEWRKKDYNKEARDILSKINHEQCGDVFEHVYYKLNENGVRINYTIEEIPVRPLI